MTSTKKDIRALSEAQIIDILKEKGEAKFRAKQIYEWLWKKTAYFSTEMILSHYVAFSSLIFSCAIRN